MYANSCASALAPACSYIDFLGFAWNMVLVALSVFIYFTGAYMDHKHRGEYFKKSEDEPKPVVLVDEYTRAPSKSDGGLFGEGRGGHQLRSRDLTDQLRLLGADRDVEKADGGEGKGPVSGGAAVAASVAGQQ
jgi:hypothetical protein